MQQAAPTPGASGEGKEDQDSKRRACRAETHASGEQSSQAGAGVSEMGRLEQVLQGSGKLTWALLMPWEGTVARAGA